MSLQGKRVILTGGSSGLGRATAEALLKKGANVLITGRNPEKLERVASELNCAFLNFDISHTDQHKKFAAKAVELMGGVDALINNAGIGEFATIDELTLESFQRVYQTNVFGLAMFTQALLPALKADGGGDIVNIASTAGTKGFAYGSVYAGSKFALRGMTQCWQSELRKDNIRVMLVNPSEVPTAFNQAERVERELVEGKLTPQEIAHTIVSCMEMDSRGFIPEVTVWATNP
ncbi:MAG: SDR family NAD(P)-dependent oxidoreductase [Flavobacteriales bacterium]|nr:SDR family NAD(P)-dependent oxidoreductase [Flavobacteriales bacterium]